MTTATTRIGSGSFPRQRLRAGGQLRLGALAMALGSLGACSGGVLVGREDTSKDVTFDSLAIEGICSVNVAGRTVSMEEEYLPNVLACEITDGSPAFLQAMAIAARSVAYYGMIRNGGICDSQACQVYSCGARGVPTEGIRAAVAATAGQILTYDNNLIYGFYVSGAVNDEFCSGQGSGHPMEDYVTYNEDKVGDAVEKTTLGWPGGNNRGCLSQNGAACLSDNRGYSARNILQYYYGSDIQVSQATGSCTVTAASGGGGITPIGGGGKPTELVWIGNACRGTQYVDLYGPAGSTAATATKEIPVACASWACDPGVCYLAGESCGEAPAYRRCNTNNPDSGQGRQHHTYCSSGEFYVSYCTTPACSAVFDEHHPERNGECPQEECLTTLLSIHHSYCNSSGERYDSYCKDCKCTAFVDVLVGSCDVAQCADKPCGASDGVGGVCVAGSGCNECPGSDAEYSCEAAQNGKCDGSYRCQFNGPVGKFCWTSDATCKPTCTPSCAGQTCGTSDGCGGVCQAGSGCSTTCTPRPEEYWNRDCVGSQYFDVYWDGCNETRRSRAECADWVCTGGCFDPSIHCGTPGPSTLICLPTCTPSCAGKTCGASDGCGGTCAAGSGCTPSVCRTGEFAHTYCAPGCFYHDSYCTNCDCTTFEDRYLPDYNSACPGCGS